jgi:hypothetical protein
MRRVLATLTVASISIFALGCSQAPTAPTARVNPTVSLSCGSTTNNDNNPATTAGGGGCNNNNNGNTGNNSNNPPTTGGN